LDSRLARIIALSVFAILIVGWVVAAVALTGASAGRPGTPFNLSSRLAADYASDGGERVSSLRISIVADLLRELGFSIEDGSVLDDLDSPVPTATARNFAGDPPFTATVAPSQVPSETPIPTETATNTPRPLPTKTKEPTDTDEPAPTEVAGDSNPPSLSGGSLSPPPGALGTCEKVINITGLHLVDAGPSSGINWVKLKYKIVGPGSQGYQYSADLSPQVSGGWTAGEGSTWDAYYDGTITIDFNTGYAASVSGGKAFFLLVVEPTATPTAVPPTATPTLEPPTATPTSPPPTSTPTPSPFDVKVWSIARDNAGNESFTFLGTYTMPGSCAD
jgi:hypothetical protein